MKRRKYCTGMFTVEMSIIFPVILLTILGLFYMGIVHYQNIVASTAAMRTASRGAYNWNAMGAAGAWGFEMTGDNAYPDGQLSGFDYTEHDPYRVFTDLFTGTGNRERNAVKYYDWLMGKEPTLLGENEYGQAPVVQRKKGLQTYVTVTVKKAYINPLGNFLERIGIYVPQDYILTAQAPLNDPVEFIRGTDFVYDLVVGR